MKKRAPRVLRWSSLGMAAVALLCGPAQAAPRSKAPRASHGKSGELREGEAALKAGDLAGAERIYSEAYRAHGSPLLLFQLGRVAQAQGGAVAAQDLWRRFLATADKSTVPPAQLAEAEQALATPLPSGEVAVLGDPGGRVFVDGHLVALLPLPLPLLVTAGPHDVRLEFPARATPVLAKLNVKIDRQVEVRFERATGAVIVSERKAVLLFVHVHDGPSDTTARLQQATVERLRNERLTTVLAPAALPPDCKSEQTCELALLSERSLPQAVLIDVAAEPKPAAAAPSPNRSYRATLSVLDAQIGEVAARLEKRCDDCTQEALTSLVTESSVEVITQGLSRQRGELVVQSEPAGALLELSGRIVGPTPYRGVRFAGSYAAVLRHPGYREHTQAVDIVEGQPTDLRITLEHDRGFTATAQLVVPPPQRIHVREMLPRPLWRLLLGGGLIAGGAVTAGFGVGALAVDGQCLDTAMLPAQQCEQHYATMPLGAGLLGAGAAVSLVGVILMAVPGPRRDFAATVTLRPCPPGTAATTSAPLCATTTEGER